MMQSYLESLFSLQGKVALITCVNRLYDLHSHKLIPFTLQLYRGGTRGIGQSLVLALAKSGADIVLVQVWPILYPIRDTIHQMIIPRETRANKKPRRRFEKSGGKYGLSLATCLRKSKSVPLCRKWQRAKGREVLGWASIYWLTVAGFNEGERQKQDKDWRMPPDAYILQTPRRDIPGRRLARSPSSKPNHSLDARKRCRKAHARETWHGREFCVGSGKDYQYR